MAKDNKKPITARLSPDTIDALQVEAKERRSTVTQIIEVAVDAHQRGGGPSAAERRIAALEATVAEQDRIIRQRTGRPTPKTKRVSVAIPLADLAQYEKQARHAGMTRAEFLRGLLASRTRALEAGADHHDHKPALPALRQ